MIRFGQHSLSRLPGAEFNLKEVSMQLEGKRILVTGGAQGIGAAIVKAYAMEGATVRSYDLNEEGGRVVAEEASDAGPGVVEFSRLDITDGDATESLFRSAARELGGIDVLVNIAGLQRSAMAEEITDDLFESIYRVNVLGTIHTNQSAYRIMQSAGTGAIINFGSMSGFTGELANATYGSSKGAVHTWTRTVAREWGPSGIRVNAVLPYVNTPMFDKYTNSLGPEELAAYQEQLRKDIPLGGTFGNAERDLAPVLVFLASDASHFITGQLLPVDGGFAAVR
ncbi:SDR family oxidoreductase [Rhodococcus opacus]|uniref:SDR family oxidoreductase n=3 Tax=Rhodococcus TaxID=1827 RepID=A0AAX3YIN7_RHOOP|nr:SDR family oxidoreductase [Rhodococcus opacus]MCZ4585290.1 SDR family oxidoreductase [Rhodococcus opacus]WLF49068.1 SDR family oxidoreductase [Rhodococcus opacus]